MLGLADFLMHH